MSVPSKSKHATRVVALGERFVACRHVFSLPSGGCHWNAPGVWDEVAAEEDAFLVKNGWTRVRQVSSGAAGRQVVDGRTFSDFTGRGVYEVCCAAFLRGRSHPTE